MIPKTGLQVYVLYIGNTQFVNDTYVRIVFEWVIITSFTRYD